MGFLSRGSFRIIHQGSVTYDSLEPKRRPIGFRGERTEVKLDPLISLCPQFAYYIQQSAFEMLLQLTGFHQIIVWTMAK